jgi:hypothetical protein
MLRALLQTALAMVLWMFPTFAVMRLIHGREEVLGFFKPFSSFISSNVDQPAPNSAVMLTFLVCTMIVLPWAMDVASKLDSSDDDEQLSFSFE